MSYKSGDMCLYYDNGLGRCAANGSRCLSPFSDEGCKLQCEDIFHNEWDEKKNKYVPDKILSSKVYTKNMIFKEIGIRKGDQIGDWFIPYSTLDLSYPQVMILGGIEEVKKKFDDVGWSKPIMRLYQNVKMCGTLGIYIIGIIRP